MIYLDYLYSNHTEYIFIHMIIYKDDENSMLYYHIDIFIILSDILFFCNLQGEMLLMLRGSIPRVQRIGSRFVPSHLHAWAKKI